MISIKAILPLFLTGAALAATTPDFSMIGFANDDGGTTGGAGGAVVTPTTLAELKTYAENKTTPYIIRITKEFNTGVAVNIDASGFVASTGTATTYGAVIKLGSNKTLVGIGTSAFFNRIGIVVQTQSNIIIRNIKFTMKDVPITNDGENKIVGWSGTAAVTLSDPDCIGIQADDTTIVEASRFSKHIWVDHCEFYNEDPSVMTNVDRYDGLVDAKNNSTDITISWCYFHDHHKASLIGKGNSDDYDRHITYHHNYFKNIASRLPLIRFGKCHLLNNYMITSENGSNARINSDLYIEANYYEASKKPVFGKISEQGAATFVNNKWINCTRVPKIIYAAGDAPGSDTLTPAEELLVGTFKPTYTYSSVLNAVADVPATVMAWSGLGKISTTEYETSATSSSSVAVSSSSTPVQIGTPIQQARDLSTYVTAKNGIMTIHAAPGTSIRVFNLLGIQLFTRTIPSRDYAFPMQLNRGTYLMQMGRTTGKIIIP